MSINDWITDMWQEYDILIVAGIVAALLLSGAIYFGIKSDREWNQFSVEHHCVVFGHKNSQTVITGNGGTGFVDSQTGYRCDDGMEYWR